MVVKMQGGHLERLDKLVTSFRLELMVQTN